MSKVQSFLTPKEIKVTRKQAQEIYNCLIGYAIANEQQGSVTTLPNFIAAWRSKSQNEVIKVLRQHDEAINNLSKEWNLLNDSYAQYAEEREKTKVVTDAEGKETQVGTGEFIKVKVDGMYKISDAEKAKEYEESLELFNFEEKRKAIDDSLYTLICFRIKAEDMMKIKSAVSYEGTTIGHDGKPVSTTVFPDYSIMYELIFG